MEVRTASAIAKQNSNQLMNKSQRKRYTQSHYGQITIDKKEVSLALDTLMELRLRVFSLIQAIDLAYVQGGLVPMLSFTASMCMYVVDKKFKGLRHF